MFQALRERRARRKLVDELVAGGDFDRRWYSSRYPDVIGIDPVEHYLQFGWKEGRFPNPIFDSMWYLHSNPDVAKSGVNPLAHYIRHGSREGRDPNPWFDASLYTSRAGDSPRRATTAVHYLSEPAATRFVPSRGFDAQAYRRQVQNPARIPDDPFCDFLHNPDAVAHGWLGDCTSTYAAGWACRNVGPAVTLTLRVNGEPQGKVTPWIRRPDVAGHGHNEIAGYFFSFARRLSPGDVVEAVDERGAPLMGSPQVYEVPQLAPAIGFIRARAAIAQTFLSGRGLEIGAFTQPTDVPAHVAVEYYDKFPPEILRRHYDENWGRPLVGPQYYGDAQSLDGVPEGAAFDFVIANHVIEHLEDPIRFLKALARVIKIGGRAMLSAPNKRFTFDSRREVTPFAHIVRDHQEGAETSRSDHYREWAEQVENLRGEDAARAAATLDRQDFSIHFHVWDESAFYHFLVRALDRYAIPFSAIFLFNANHEIVVVLERGEAPSGRA